MTSQISPKPQQESADPDRPSTLRAGAVGAPGITFFVVAAAAPLTCVIGITPFMIGFGTGVGAPLVYLVIGAVLLLFSVGYVAMTKHVPNPGALYAYVAQGLGSSAGIGAALMSLLAYVTALVTLTAFFGYSLNLLFVDFFGVSPPWYVCCLVAIIVITALGRREVSIGAKLLAVLLTAEVGILVMLAVAVLVRGGAHGVTFESFNPHGLLAGGIGVSLAFAYASYVGFEQTAIYAEEAKDPHGSVKRATFAAVGLITLFYAVITWVVILAFGSDAVVPAAAGAPGSLILDATQQYLGTAALRAMNVLVVTSSFAAIFSFHNATARYVYALGRDGILPRSFGKAHSVTSAPYRASLTVGILNAALLLGFWLAGTDPYLGVFSWGSGAAAVGFIALQVICSAAVFRFFRRLPGREEGNLTTVVSPVLAFIGLLAVLALIIANFSTLVGIDVGRLALIVPVAFLAVGIAGLVYGLVLKRQQPDVWRTVGRSALPAADTAP